MKKPLIAVAVGVVVAAGASAAIAAVPRLATEGPNVTVKPGTLLYTGDGSGFFAGAHKVSKHKFGNLHWSKWNNTEALGSGANWLNNCQPSCAAGHFSGYPAKLKLTTPKVVEGHDVWTRMLVTYTGKLPPRVHTKLQTWKLGHHKKFYFWNQPS